MAADAARRVCLARIVGVHGIRGEVRIEAFTEFAEDFASYGELTDASGAISYEIASLRDGPRGLIARIKGVADRNQAEALRGIDLYVLRSQLPDPDEADEYYRGDLVGLVVEGPDGAALGTVQAVHNFGAGDILEIARPGQPTRLVPFNPTAVPVVDMEQRRLVVDYPED